VSHVKILGVRSIVLATFAMTHAFWPLARDDNSIFAWGLLTVILAAIFAVSVRVTPGPHRAFTTVMAVVTGLVGAVALIGGIVVGPELLVWTIVVFGVVTGISEIGAARVGNQIPGMDHTLLGGASLMLALASLIGPLETTWLSGVMVAWAAIGAVIAGTASVGWKDQIRAEGAKENVS
jgi:hypothetical protein